VLETGLRLEALGDASTDNLGGTLSDAFGNVCNHRWESVFHMLKVEIVKKFELKLNKINKKSQD